MTLNNYFKLSFTYGFLRKFSYIYGTNYIINKKEKPILITDYLIFCTYSGITSICFSPFFLLNDIKYLEIKMRKYNLNDYKIKNNEEDKKFSNILFDYHINYI
jgi:hypothetical protein